GDVLGLELLDEGPHRLVELGEAGGVAPFGGDVGSVDDYVVDRHGMPGVREGGGPRSGVALGGGGPPGSPICRDTAGALRVARTALPDGGAGPHEGPSAGYFAGRRVDMVCSIGPGACQSGSKPATISSAMPRCRSRWWLQKVRTHTVSVPVTT